MMLATVAGMSTVAECELPMPMHTHRSIYRKADVYILDDPLSAVDTIVGRRLFETCLNGVLRNSVVVLVTHQLQYAQLADTMLVMDQVCRTACSTVCA